MELTLENLNNARDLYGRIKLYIAKYELKVRIEKSYNITILDFAIFEKSNEIVVKYVYDNSILIADICIDNVNVFCKRLETESFNDILE